LRLLYSQVLVLVLIRAFNDGGITCTQQGLLKVCRMNKHSMSNGHLGHLCGPLVDGGLLVLRGGIVVRWAMDLRLTVQGRQLLDEYEALLSSYVVKGVPVVI